MNEIVRTTETKIVTARQPINIREATPADFAFVDALQKAHSKQVGFLHRKAIETYVAKGDVLIAEEIRDQKSEVHDEGMTSDRLPRTSGSRSLGYVIGCDRYYKRNDVGIVYQLNVAPGSRRKLVGAMLVKAMFDRAAYGCKLFCCWCAQDIEANHFWESLGFVPLAFRTGSANNPRKGRIHIFWQRRIREGDTQTPYWFPSETNGGAIRGDRLVIPIPPGTHWSDAKPVILPGAPEGSGMSEASGQLEGANAKAPFLNGSDAADGAPKRVRRRKKKNEAPAKPKGPRRITSGGLWFDTPEERAERRAQEAAKTKVGEKKTARRKTKPKNDPRLVTMARELQAKWLEQIAAHPELVQGSGKYDISRSLEAQPPDEDVPPIRYLHAA